MQVKCCFLVIKICWKSFVSLYDNLFEMFVQSLKLIVLAVLYLSSSGFLHSKAIFSKISLTMKTGKSTTH